jgi:serine kinase of HPr protein (carbohydrate metabolism regulator)
MARNGSDALAQRLGEAREGRARRSLAHDDVDETWDRLGIDDEWYPLLGTRIAMRRVPVRPGKNTSSTVEVAARNELLRQAGHHSAREFHARLASAMGVHDPTAILRGKG